MEIQRYIFLSSKRSILLIKPPLALRANFYVPLCLNHSVFPAHLDSNACSSCLVICMAYHYEMLLSNMKSLLININYCEHWNEFFLPRIYSDHVPDNTKSNISKRSVVLAVHYFDFNISLMINDFYWESHIGSDMTWKGVYKLETSMTLQAWYCIFYRLFLCFFLGTLLNEQGLGIFHHSANWICSP